MDSHVQAGPGRVWLAAMLVIVGVYAGLAYRRNAVWRSELALWDDTVHKSPAKARPYSWRGLAYQRRGQTDAALADYAQALALDPHSWIAHNNAAVSTSRPASTTARWLTNDQALQIKPRLRRSLVQPRHVPAEERASARGPWPRSTARWPWPPPGPTPTSTAAARSSSSVAWTPAIADLDRGLALDPASAGAYLKPGHRRPAARGNLEQALSDAEMCRRLGGDITEFRRLQQALRK